MEYKCPICGKSYTTATEMAQCVTRCAQEEDSKGAKLKEITDRMDVLMKELAELQKQYNSLSPDSEINITKTIKTKHVYNPSKWLSGAAPVSLEEFFRDAVFDK